MKVTILLPLLTVGAYVAISAGSSKAADSIYRSGDFKRTTAEIADCAGLKLVKRHPELNYITMLTPAGRVSGA
jgi:hypothetical protein